MAHVTFQHEYLQIPPVTRAYTTACFFTTVAVVCMFLYMSSLLRVILFMYLPQTHGPHHKVNQIMQKHKNNKS